MRNLLNKELKVFLDYVESSKLNQKFEKENGFAMAYENQGIKVVFPYRRWFVKRVYRLEDGHRGLRGLIKEYKPIKAKILRRAGYVKSLLVFDDWKVLINSAQVVVNSDMVECMFMCNIWKGEMHD